VGVMAGVGVPAVAVPHSSWVATVAFTLLGLFFMFDLLYAYAHTASVR